MKYVNGGWIHSDFAKNAVISLISLEFLRLIDPNHAKSEAESEHIAGSMLLNQPIIIRIGIADGKMAVIDGADNILSAVKEGYSHLPATFQLSNHLPSALLRDSYSLSVYTKDPDLTDLWVSHGKVIKFDNYQDVKYVHPELVLLPEYLENHFFE